ncbi:MAG: helix-turn-helix domain-containing protein [Halobacteriota archaeon]
MVALQDSESSVDMDNLMTLDEAAQSLRVTKTTIRRRIKRGELHAIKKMGPYGKQYFVPRNAISTAQEVTDVVPITRQVNLLTLGDVIEQAIVTANEPLKKEFMERINKVSIEMASIKQQNESGDLKNDIAELQREVRSVKLLALDYDAQLKKLNAYLNENSQVAPKKTLRERIFGKKR